jgi:hypothetical protein
MGASSKGNWYLSDPKTISTKTYGNYITIPFAHKCDEAEVGSERNESFLFDLQARSGAKTDAKNFSAKYEAYRYKAVIETIYFQEVAVAN